LQQQDFEQRKEDERPGIKNKKEKIRETAEVLCEID
jgi:hypothetical protein